MKLLFGLSLDQVSHTPGCPQGCAIAQHFRAFLESAAQRFQLRGLKPGFAARTPSFEEGLGPLSFPNLMPATDRLAVDPQLPGHFALTEAPVEESGRFESPPFQAIEIAFNAFRIAHAQRLS